MIKNYFPAPRERSSLKDIMVSDSFKHLQDYNDFRNLPKTYFSVRFSLCQEYLSLLLFVIFSYF